MDRKPDRWRMYRLVATEAGRALRGRVARGVASLRLGSATPARLLFAPQDLRTADPTVASDIYAGFFVFSGRAVATGGRSPFAFEPPTRAWGEAFYGFGWLRHLRAAGTALAQANARSLVDEFIAAGNGGHGISRETHVTARRLISFVSQSPLILDGADHAFYHRFLKVLGRNVRDLERALRFEPQPYRRLQAATAICYAGLCCEGLDGPLRRAGRVLARELDRQILPDGGHASRNPRILIDLLFDLLPLRQMYASREVDTPAELVHAIDRMLPMLRLFRHKDGTLSHFNGMGVTAADHLATLLTYDDLRSRPIHRATHSGYERLEAGRSLLVADVGPTPDLALSAEAAAGCLSFEFSSGAARIVVNCGLPRHASEAVAQAARTTTAHSTATLDDASSCQFLAPGGLWLERRLAAWLARRLGPVALTGPRDVRAERTERDQAIALQASHDGYEERFGVVHERRWRLSAQGQLLEGEDVFLSEGASAPGTTATVRFHLAPGIRASRAQGGRVVMLVLPNREAWQFESDLAEARLEDSVFFAASDGPRRTEQIVLRLNLDETPAVRWRLERLSRGSEAAAPQRQAEPIDALL